MNKKPAKKLLRLVFRECMVMMMVPMLLNALGLTSASILGTVTANTLGDFADAAFALNLSLGLEKIFLLVVCILVAVVIVPGINLLSDYVMLIYALRHDNIVFGHYLDKDPEKAMTMDLGEVQYQLEDAPCMMRIYWVDFFSKIIAVPVSLAFLLYWSGQVSWGLTGLVFLFCVFKLIVPLLFKEKLADYDREEKAYLAERRSCESDIANMPHLIALWQTKKSHLERMQVLFQNYYQKTASRQIVCKIFSEQSKELLDQLILALLLFGGAFLISSGKMSPGGLASMLIYLTVIQSALSDIGSVIQQYPLMKNEANRVCKFYADAELDSGERLKHFEGLFGENVSFAYTDKPVFQGLDFSIQRGERVALQGENGHGKSTLIKLICGLLKSYQGDIRIGKNDLKHVSLESWRRLVAYAPQDPMLFGVTVRENVMLGNPDAPKELVDEYMEDFGISALSERTVSEDTDLSGGERQKISIIRAMLKKSELLILDEPSNHLDINSIEALKRHIRQMDKTVIFISHDPLLTEAADRVLAI